MEPTDDELPPMLVVADDEQLRANLGPKELTNPRYVARAWVDAAFDDAVELFEALCADPSEWSTAAVRDMLGGESGLSSRLHPAKDRPDEVVTIMAVVNFASQSVVAHEVVPVEAYPLTLIRLPDGTWRVWRLGGEGIPQGADVFLD